VRARIKEGTKKIHSAPGICFQTFCRRSRIERIILLKYQKNLAKDLTIILWEY